jgi:hypothetical protein
MSASTTAVAASTGKYGREFWERLWRQSGLNFVAFFVVAWLVYGTQPQIGASSEELATFYGGGHTRILIAAFIAGMAVLNLMWFAAALRNTLADAGQDGWGSAATASSAAVGGLFLLLIAIAATLVYSGDPAGNGAVAGSLSNFAWVLVVLSSFPRAMLIMSGSFGLWRAGQFSNTEFALGVTAVVLVLLGGTTWMSTGFWSPDGAYSRYVSPAIGLGWVLFVSRVLLSRSPSAKAGW